MREAGVHVLTARSGCYPAALRTIHDPPIVLYVWGEIMARDGQGVGVVGIAEDKFLRDGNRKKTRLSTCLRWFYHCQWLGTWH